MYHMLLYEPNKVCLPVNNYVVCMYVPDRLPSPVAVADRTLKSVMYIKKDPLTAVYPALYAPSMLHVPSTQYVCMYIHK